jgi:hypothetical protein
LAFWGWGDVDLSIRVHGPSDSSFPNTSNPITPQMGMKTRCSEVKTGL